MVVPQALAAGLLSKYLSGTANILEDLEDRITELLQRWSVSDANKPMRLSSKQQQQQDFAVVPAATLASRQQARPVHLSFRPSVLPTSLGIPPSSVETMLVCCGGCCHSCCCCC